MTDIESRAFELKVGIFIAAGIIIFFIVVFSIGDVYLVKSGYHINVIFSFANGIREGAPVRLAGVNVGQVDKIQIFFDEESKKTKVKIHAWINKDDIKVERDSLAVINTLGLLGEKYLEIFPGSDRNQMLANDATMLGRDPISTESITEKVGELASSVLVVMNRLKDGEGTIGKLLTNDKIYNDMEAFVEDIKKHPWKLLSKPRGGDRQ